MIGRDENIRRALRGEGPLFEAMLDERARDLAVCSDDGRTEAALVSVLVMRSAGTARWALPLPEVARVEPLPRAVSVPVKIPGLMGLVLLAGRRCMLADLGVLAGGAPAREPERVGHAVLLRHLPLALAVDRVEDIASIPVSTGAGDLLADGTVLLDVARLAAKTQTGGSGG